PIAQQYPNLLSHGTGDTYWIAQVFPRRANEKLSEYTVIRGRQVGGDARWLEVARVQARVISIANRGNEVVALLDGGDWMIIWTGGSSMGRAPDDGARLVTLCSGATSL